MTSADEESTRRTSLALERTELAWWRTGLAALAVGIGVGRVVPGLENGDPAPFEIAGAAFALYGVALFAYGSLRGRKLTAQLERGEETGLAPSLAAYALGTVGALLGVASAILIVVG